jgi:predicted nucleotidyltransferase
MTDTVKSELDRIVSTLVNTGIVTKIILFGSYAKGEETSASDIDLCVLTRVSDRDPLDLTIDLRVKLIKVRERPLDLFAYNQDDFSADASRPGSFQYSIAKDGVVLYGQ